MGAGTDQKRYRVEFDTPPRLATIAGSRIQLPERFSFLVLNPRDLQPGDPLPELEFVVEDGQLRCERIGPRRQPGGRGVETKDQAKVTKRIPLREVSAVLAMLIRSDEISWSPDGSIEVHPTDPSTPEGYARLQAQPAEFAEIERLVKRAIDQHEQSRGRNPLTPEKRQEVADVYRRAAAEGRPIYRSIMEHFPDCNRPRTARNWIRKCREGGELPPSDEDPVVTARKAKRATPGA